MCEAEKRWLEAKSKEWKAEGIKKESNKVLNKALNKESNKAARIIVKKCIERW